jgi:hypothetical protein
VPVSLLDERSISSRFLSWPKKDGTGPKTLVPEIVRYLRFLSLAIVDGIVPVILGKFRNSRRSREGRSPTEEDI